MIKVKADLKYLETCVKGMRQIRANLPKKARKIMSQSAKFLKDRIRFYAPKFTGFLANSVRVSYAANSIQVRVSAPYAAPQETGFREHIIYHLTPTRVGGIIFGEWILAHGYKPAWKYRVRKHTPYVSPALTDLNRQIKSIINKELKAMSRK